MPHRMFCLASSSCPLAPAIPRGVLGRRSADARSRAPCTIRRCVLKTAPFLAGLAAPTSARPPLLRGSLVRAAEAASVEAQEGTIRVKDVQRAIVVGAGPAGSATAMLLAKEGYDVQVFERRADPLIAEPSSPSVRGFGIVINQRGLHALNELGISLPAPDCGVKFEGSLRHTSKATSSSPNSDGVVCVDRGALARYMVHFAREQYGDNITFHFNTKFLGLDPSSNTAVFEGQGSVSYDLLVGADGSRSAVRDALAGLGSISYTQEENQRDYKSFSLSKDLWDSEPEYKNKMLTWSSIDGSVTRMWAVPNPDGTGQGMLTLYKGAFQGLDKPSDYAALLKDKFAGVRPEMLSAIADSCSSAPVSSGGTMVKCSTLHAGSIALVGDAGHSMYPALGQGCNSAIESGAALVETLKKYRGQGTLADALSEYTATRLPEVSAAADLSAQVIDIDGSTGVIGAFKKAIFGLQIVSSLLLSKVFPSVVAPPFLFEVNKVGASYVKLKQRSRWETVLLSLLVLGFAAALTSMAVKLIASARVSLGI